MSVLRNEKTRRVALMGLLFALSVVLSFLEGTLTPLLGLPPGVKLGLANVVVMYALFFLGRGSAFTLVLLKSFFVLLTRGAMAGALSLGGGLLSLGVMAVLCLFRSRPSVFILSVCGAITHNFGQLLVINLLMTGVVLWFVKRYSPLPWMSLFFYLTLQFFAHSMNLFRQSIAATICLLAYPFLKKRKLLPFALVVLLAAAFHTSALFFLPFYWILNWKCDGRLLGGLAMAAVPVYLFSNQAAQLLTQYLFPNYAGYIGSRYWAGLGYRYAIFPILYFAAAWLTRRWLLAERQENRILINSSFYVMLLYVFSTHHMILERFSIYLFPYAMLLLPKMVVSVPAVQGEDRKKENKHLERQRRESMVLLAVLAVAAGFAYLCFASMQGTNGFHKVYPYVSVWS